MQERRQDWHTVLPFVVALASFGALALWDHSRGFNLWRNYALSGVVLGSATTWVLWYYDVRLPHYIQWIIGTGLILHYGGGSIGSPDEFRMGVLGAHGINGAYHTFDWWDNLTHGVGIGAGAMGCAYLLELYQVRRGLHWTATAVGVVAFLSAMAAGVAVELYEYLGKTVFQTIDQGGYTNTMTDLVFNALGAAAGATIAATVNRRRFRARIQAQWEIMAPQATGWFRRVPPGMVGFIAFVSIPAATSMALALRFLVTGAQEQDLALYDHALDMLTRSAVAGFVAGPLVSMAAREMARRREPAA